MTARNRAIYTPLESIYLKCKTERGGGKRKCKPKVTGVKASASASLVHESGDSTLWFSKISKMEIVGAPGRVFYSIRR